MVRRYFPRCSSGLCADKVQGPIHSQLPFSLVDPQDGIDLSNKILFGDGDAEKLGHPGMNVRFVPKDPLVGHYLPSDLLISGQFHHPAKVMFEVVPDMSRRSMPSHKPIKETARGRIICHLYHEQPTAGLESLSGCCDELTLFLIRKVMYACDGYHGVEIVLPYAGQFEVCLEDVPPVQLRRHNEIRKGDLLIHRDTLYQAAFEGNIEDPSCIETFYRVIEMLNLRRAGGIILCVGMDQVVVIPKSFLVRRRHDSPRSPFLEHGFPR
jgi:hypothetical protein